MTQRLCRDLGQDMRATQVGLSVWYFLHSANTHQHCSGSWGVNSEKEKFTAIGIGTGSYTIPGQGGV